MAETLKKFDPVVNHPTSGKHTATLIFMHGTGGTGQTLRDGVRDKIKCNFAFPHIKIVFPTAPLMPYTLKEGKPTNAWFDRAALEPSGDEFLATIDNMAIQLEELIQAEVATGIPKNRIVIGGFSMGASMALHLCLRFQREVAAVVSLSTFLYNDSEVYRILEDSPPERLPPVFFCHGDVDQWVAFDWGVEMFKRLSGLGVQGTFRTLPGLKHSLNRQELGLVKTWIMNKVPEI